MNTSDAREQRANEEIDELLEFELARKAAMKPDEIVVKIKKEENS